MAASIDNNVVAELWEALGERRYMTPGSPDLDEDARRAIRAAENLRYTENLLDEGWFVSASPMPIGAHKGRGWHDAHMPCKIPLTLGVHA